MTVVDGDATAPYHSLLHQGVGDGTTLSLDFSTFTLDLYLIMLLIRRYQVPFSEFLLWLDLGLKSGLRAISKHCTHSVNGLVYIYIYIYIGRCLWCNGYCRRKWTRWHVFKTWTRLIAFHIELIPLGMVLIQLFSLQLWVNSRTDWFLQAWWGN